MTFGVKIPLAYLRPTLKQVLGDVEQEVLSAEANWPQTKSTYAGYEVLVEQFLQLEEHVFEDRRHRDLVAMRAEAVQVAALAIRLIRDVIDNGRGRV